MSLTPLGTQLTGFNAPRNELGSTLRQSRQHEDSIGRGLSHSVQLGHFDAKKSKIFKSSIIHEDARKARDVPLVTLRENAMSSLRRLELIDGRFGEYVTFLQRTSKERPLMTRCENAELDKILDELLHRLILRISDNSTSSKTLRASVFHVIEYLLRRYDIHQSTRLAETLLRLMVPLHEDPIFLKIIQIVDLSILPTWSFLRPYCVRGARVAREAISRQASIDGALLSELCRLAKRSAELPCSAHHLSFVATVISECAGYQVTNLGDLTERTCHTLLQQTLGACRQSKISALQDWGHVIASIILETASLAEGSRDMLVTSILHGVIDCKVSTQMNGLVVAFNAISQRWKHIANPQQVMRFFLTDEHGMKNGTFHELLCISDLSSQLGSLYAEEGIDHVSSWIACTVVVGARLLQEDTTTRAKEVQKVILDLIREPRLHSLWGSPMNTYLESFASIFVEISAKDDTKAYNGFEQAIFGLLNSIDSSAFENGIVSAFSRMTVQKRKRILPRIPRKHHNEIQTVAASPLNDHVGIRLTGEHMANESSFCPSIAQARELLALLNHDTNNTVAIEAGKVLVDLLRRQKDCSTRKEIGESALQEAYKWFSIQQGSWLPRITVLSQVFRLLECICLCVLSNEPENDLIWRVIECFGAFSSSSNGSVSQQSSEILRGILGRMERGAEYRNIHAMILSDHSILYIFRRDVSGGDDLELYVRRCYAKSLLQGYVEILRSCYNAERRQLYAIEMMEYCIWFVVTFVDKLQPQDATMMGSCIKSLGKLCVPPYELMRLFTVELASIKGTSFHVNFSSVTQSVSDSLWRSESKVPWLLPLMDMAVFASQKGKDTAVTNILLMATIHIRTGEAALLEVHYAIATALCFLAHTNMETRHEAVDLLKSTGNFFSARVDKQQTCLAEVCVYIAERKSNILIGGGNLLAWCLSSVMSQSKKKRQLREAILGLGAIVAAAHDSTSHLSDSKYFATGGYVVATTLLAAAESVGEEFFPLVDRWELAGSPILKYVQSHLLQLEEIPDSLELLVQATILMLKGSKVMNAEFNVVEHNVTCTFLSRKDASSDGESDAARFLSPYPKDMESTILSILENDGKSKMTRLLRRFLVGMVFGSQAWTSRVFSSLSSPFREKIASKILAGVVAGLDGFNPDTLMNLPLSSSQVARMVKSGKRSAVEISSLSEYIIINNKRMNGESPDNKLISALFGHLEASLSKVGIISSAESNYSVDAILSAVLELIKPSYSTHLCVETKEVEVENWGIILLGILKRNSSSQENWESLRAHKTCIGVLANLCLLFPSIVGKKLIPAMNATICKAIGSSASGFLIDCLVQLLPLFLKFAESIGESPVDLFRAFVFESMRSADSKLRISLYQGFIEAITRISPAGQYERLPGAFVSVCLCMELHFENSHTSETLSITLRDMAYRIMVNSHVAIKTSSIVEMLAYAKAIINTKIIGKETIKFGTMVKVEELILLSIKGEVVSSEGYDLMTHPKSLLVCKLLLLSVWKNTQAASFQKFLRNLSSSLLRFWQDLSLVQAACRNLLLHCSQEHTRAVWDNLLCITDAILGNLHAFIPVHIFLALATCVIENGETEELRSITVRSVADRATLIDPMAAEATLFRETLSFFLEMVSAQRTSLQQSVLVAIEVIVRKLFFGSDFQVSSTLLDQLEAVIFKTARLIETELSSAGSDFMKITPPSRKTICIASLCVSTCIRICGPRALRALSIFMKTQTSTLRMSTDLFGNKGVQQGMKKEATLMQVSAIHSIIAVVETLPHFLAPHLRDVLALLALPSKTLREQNETLELVHKLDEVLVSNVPARILIPSVLESIDSNCCDARSLCAMVSLLSGTVSSSSRQNVLHHATGLLHVVTSTLEYPVHPQRQSHLLHAASNLFLGFVLKLSEIQLRSLYLKLREWKGDLDYTNLGESASRRGAFWSMSAALATNLQSIYLPCLSLVSEDLIKELESAAKIFSGHLHVPGASKTKRQRLGHRSQSSMPPFDTKPVENALLCLQVSLQCDANDGGSWIREDGASKFERLLSPLTKLLQYACPPEAPSTTTYEKLVQGADSQSSSVVACIVHLALAAGQEQLWKPLNHCVLQAASSEKRAEVRKAGVQCLASLIQIIGEEYMVFIPECLPVLSELLEDADRSIATLAHDCVTLSEEFLGEKLQQCL